MIKNPRQKGSRNELKCKRELEEQGWNCEKVKNAGKFQKQVDFFGYWDILALKPKIIKFVQVKTNKKPVFQPYSDFAFKYGLADVFQFEIWIWRDRKGFLKYSYSYEKKSFGRI